jgi:hypothetical protein
MAITTLEEYLKEFSVEIGDRILTSIPALHAPGEPVSPILKTLLRKPFAAQEVAIAGAVKRLREANSVAIISAAVSGLSALGAGGLRDLLTVNATPKINRQGMAIRLQDLSFWASVRLDR